MLNPTQTHAQNHPTPLRILFLEDDPQDRELAARAIAAEGLLPEFVYAVTQADFEGALARQAFDLIMSDFTLPAYTGADALAVAKKVQPDTPFVFFSGTIGEERAVESLKSGATDYVLKDRPETLIPAIRRALREASLRRDRKLAEDALRASEARYRSLFENMVEGFAYCRIFFAAGQAQDFLYLEVNGAFEKLTGLKNVVGRKMSEVVPGLLESQPELLRVFGRVAMTGHPERIEIEIKALAGWYSIAAYSMEPGSFMIVFDNITERKALEADLRQAQKMEAIGQLAGGVAHDFNNMLAGILGSAELVREDLGDTHPSQQYIQSIMTAANRSRELVQQILTFSRRQESEKQVLRLQPIVGECVKLLRSTIPAMVKITHYVDAKCPPVLANPTQIHQVVMNICTNAWQALAETGGRIDITLRALEVDADMVARHRELRLGSHACLTVTDNGCGMDAATRKRIFEPFFTTKPISKGSGLGLSVVHGIIKSHLGAILVESEPGRGTTFQIYLPTRPASQKESPSPVSAIPHGHGERILFVDDEAIVGRSTEEFLRRLGYAVTRFEESEEALARFRQAPQDFDLIFTDWAMPVMSGTELVSAMHEVRPGIPMLLMSGFVDNTMEKNAKTTGIGEVLTKPVTPELLAQAVAQVLSRASKTGAGKPFSSDAGPQA